MKKSLNKAQNLIDQPTSSSLQQSKSFQSQSADENFPYNFSDTEKQNSLNKIYQLYLYHGPSWKYIQSQLKQDQYGNYSVFNNPKNFIYNSIRSSAKTLAKIEVEQLGKRRRLVSRDTLLSMLEIINQVQAEIIARNLTLNQDSLLFTFKKNLLRFSLWEDSLSEEEVLELIKLIKQINLKLRCLSIFKAKHRKNWKLSDKALRLISTIDKIAMEVEFGEGLPFNISAELTNQMRQKYIDRYSNGNQGQSILVNNLQQIQSFFKPTAQVKWSSSINQGFQENFYQKQKIDQFSRKKIVQDCFLDLRMN